MITGPLVTVALFFARQQTVSLVEQLPMTMLVQCLCIALHEIPQHLAVVCYQSR
jgi:hypothetical protein